MIEHLFLPSILILSYYTSWLFLSLPTILILNLVFLFRPIEFVSIITAFNLLTGGTVYGLVTWLLSSFAYVTSVYYYTKDNSILRGNLKEIPLEMLSNARYSFTSNNVLAPWFITMATSFISIPIVVISMFTEPWFVRENEFEKCRSKRMIVFIHGDSSNKNQWLIIRLVLDFIGYKPHYAINLFTGTFNRSHPSEHTSLLLCADIAKAKINEFMTEHVEEVILVGHSLGGLVAAHLAENALKGKVIRVIAISSPFNGSQVVDIANNFGFMNTQMFQEYVIGAQRNLVEQMKYSHVKYLFITGENDILVRPQSAIPESVSERDNKIILPNVGHYNVKMVPDTVNILLNWL